MKSPENRKRPSSPWFAIRKELNETQKFILTCLSFLLPLILWACVSYSPFIWHPDVKLQISANRSDVTTVYTAGDHLSKTYYPEFVAAIQSDNEGIRAARDSGDISGSGFSIRRANLKNMRHLSDAAVANKWLTREEAKADELLYEVWQAVAEGTLPPGKVNL